MSKSKKQLKAQIRYLEHRICIEELEWQERYKRQAQEFAERTCLMREQLNNLMTKFAEGMVLSNPVYIVPKNNILK